MLTYYQKTLKNNGLTKFTARRWQKLNLISEEDFEEFKKAGEMLAEVYRSPGTRHDLTSFPRETRLQEILNVRPG